MFTTLLIKEIRNTILTFRFGIAFISILILTLASFWVQADDYTRRLDNYNLTAEKNSVKDREVYLPSEVTPTIHRRPSPLSIFAQGENSRYGNMVTVYRWLVPREASGTFSNNNLVAALPSFDLMQITIVVISLFGAMLGFDGISGERENATLRSMCSTSVGRRTIYTAKFLGNTIVLALPIIIALLGGLLYVLLFKSIPFSAAQWGAIALMAFTAVLYGALFIAISLLCSTLFTRSSISLVFSLILWLLGSIAIPVFAKTLSEYLEPLPSPAELGNLEATSLRDASEAYKEFTERYPDHPWGIFTGGYGVGSGLTNDTVKFDGSPTNFREAEEYVRFMENYMIQRADRIWDAYRKVKQKSEQQARLASLFSTLSPAYHVRSIFTGLAGTDYRSYENFMENARFSRRALLQEFRSRGYFSNNALQFFSQMPRDKISSEAFIERQRKYRSGELERGPQNAWDYLPESQVPHFPDESPEPDFMAVLSNLTALLLAVPVIVMFGVLMFNRYDVR